jgi:hypothetical protein
LAAGELLLFCDDDMIVQPAHLRLHVDTHEAVGRAVVGSDRWYTPESLALFAATPFGRYRVQLEREFQSGIVDCQLEADLYETATLASCDMSIARAGFWELGGFDESFPYAGAEDQDLSIRAKRAGYRLIRNRGVQPKHDDQAVTLRQFGLREERGAETVVAFEKKYPEACGPFAANRPLSLDDGPRLVARKLMKAALSRPLPMEVAYWVTGVAERAGASDPTLQRMYRVILGLHIFRGYRKAFRRTGAAFDAKSRAAETPAGP